MAGPLTGVRVLEVASYVFGPICGAVLGEWGADVIKVEDPVHGDIWRRLSTRGLERAYHGVDPSFEAANRGKRSIGIDLRNPDGRRVLTRLLEHTDVFV